MREARKALLQPDTGGATVTRVAMQFGFFELGRFAVEYRLTFGESPSVTLRRSSAARRDLAWAEPASVPLQYSAANVIRFIPRRDSGRRHDVMNAQT
jgi:AraC-like DNA-binding protein